MPDQMQQSRWAPGGQERGEGLREADAWRHIHRRTHNARAASRWVVQQQVTAAAGKDAAAYLKRKEGRRIDVAFSAVGLFELSWLLVFSFLSC